MTTFEEGIALYNDDEIEAAYNALIGLAQDGNDEAQFMIGLMYYRGDFVERNTEKAVFWFKRSARQLNVEAASMLMECDSTSTAHTNRF